MYFAQNGTYLGPIAGTNPDPVTAKVGFNENATLPFQPGKTYRLRIVNTSAFAAFFFWIDGHEMRIIEVDGVRPPYPAMPAIRLHVYRLTSRSRPSTSSPSLSLNVTPCS